VRKSGPSNQATTGRLPQKLHTPSMSLTVAEDRVPEQNRVVRERSDRSLDAGSLVEAGLYTEDRRGHDILSIRDSRMSEGGALQLTREGIADNDYAARWIADHGFPAPVVIAHSGGGMLGVAHVAEHPRNTRTGAALRVSRRRGGRADPSPQMALAGEGYEATMANALALVEAGRGKELITVPNWWYVISAESYVDRFTAMPDILAPRSHGHVSGHLPAGQPGAEGGVSSRTVCRARRAARATSRSSPATTSTRASRTTYAASSPRGSTKPCPHLLDPPKRRQRRSRQMVAPAPKVPSSFGLPPPDTYRVQRRR
jgi:pimeloyl-ACP methyl ester carboxylesterase